MVRLELPYLPPSVNHAYINVPSAGRCLSPDGKDFKKATRARLVLTHPRELAYFRPNVPYLLVFAFYFREVENKGWATGKAKHRYKSLDGGNRTKLLEDVLAEAAGVDDRHTFSSHWEKCGPLPPDQHERTVILAWDLDKETGPFDSVLRPFLRPEPHRALPVRVPGRPRGRPVARP